MRLEVRIDELGLRGVGPAYGRRLAAELERELARRLAAGGVPAAWRSHGRTPRLDTGVVPFTPGAPGVAAPAVGRAVARALHAALAPAAGAPGAAVPGTGRRPPIPQTLTTTATERSNR